MSHPCQNGFNCPMGRKVSESKIVCSMPRCVVTEQRDAEFRFFERLMQGQGTYERRGGKVRQRRQSDSG